MVALRRQVLAEGPVQVQAHRDRTPALLVHHPQPHRTVGGGDPGEPGGRPGQLVHDRLAVCGGDVEPRPGMGRVLDHRPASRALRLHIGLRTGPALRRVLEHRPGADDDAEIDVDAVDGAVRPRLHSVGQGQAHLLAPPGPQRMILETRVRETIEQRALLARRADHALDRLLRAGVREREQPHRAGYVVGGGGAGLAAAVGQERPAVSREALPDRRHHRALEVRHRREGARAPGHATLLDLDPAGDERARLAPVRVLQPVLGDDRPDRVAVGVAPLRNVAGEVLEAAGQRRRPILDRVREDEEGGPCAAETDLHRRLVQQRHVRPAGEAEIEGDALQRLRPEQIGDRLEGTVQARAVDVERRLERYRSEVRRGRPVHRLAPLVLSQLATAPTVGASRAWAMMPLRFSCGDPRTRAFALSI